MNLRLAERIRMNGYKFNLLFGVFSLAVVPLIYSSVDLRLSNYTFGLIGLLVYFGEAWAFRFKTKLMRVRIVHGLSGGSTTQEIPSLPKLGCLVNYGFIMRLCFRIAMLAFSLIGFGIVFKEDRGISNFALAILIAGTLFELFLMMLGMFEGGAIEDKKDNPEKRKEKETEWRIKNFPLLDDPKLYLKELGADFTLFAAAMMFTHFFWVMSNNTFIGSIDQSHRDGDSAFGVLLPIILANTVLCLFMLVPIRLAYWIGESISVLDDSHKWRLRFSLVFAGVSIIFPVLVHFVRVYYF